MNGKIIDLRSDTVTLPLPEMREAIAGAALGDDILGEDPTVHELEERAAAMLGMEAGLLVISGTMANQVAVMTLTERGQEVIVGQDSHIYNLETAGLSTLSQVQVRPLEVIDGTFDPERVERLIQAADVSDVQRAETGLICLENTYNLNEGQVITPENTAQIREVANQYGIPVYLDGARLFNASVALGVEPAELCKDVDAVQICLTKGLGCPLGSILAGSKPFIAKARKIRQRLGGGMRQAGIVAAPGIFALEHMIQRLEDDHRHALKLARAVSAIDGLAVDPDDVQTNIVSPTIVKQGWDTDRLLEKLQEQGIKVKKIGRRTFRMVTHVHISGEDIDRVIAVLRRLFQ